MDNSQKHHLYAMNRSFAKPIIYFTIMLVFLLSACNPTPKAEATSTRQSAIARPVTTATITSALEIDSLTPTITQPLQADCPAKKPEISANFEDSNGTAESNQHLFSEILDFLNAGGSRQSVIAAYVKKHPQADQSDIQEKDVTADGISDLLLTEPNNLVAFVCQNGQYQINWLISETYHFSRPHITKIIDMNHDGIDEIISSSGHDMRFQFVEVFEWRGDEFSLLNNLELPDYYEKRVCTVLMGTSNVSTPDIDNDGRLELVLEQGIPTWSEYSMGMPWRKEKRICKWDGKAFSLNKIEITDPPHYRFEALQDADRASLQGDYAKALDLYQQTIFNDKLDWWSLERRRYEINLTDEERGYNPTPLPSMSADPAEYLMLAAYARFRIMLLYTVQGDSTEAQIAYDTLQEKFPVGQAGHIQAEVAKAFWLEYQASKNITKSCAKAIEYTTIHPADVLSYLGNSQYNTDIYHGSQSLEYKPEDICPFH